MLQTISVLRNAVRVLAAVGILAYGAAALVTVGDVLGRQVGLPIQGVVDLVQLFVMAGAWLVMPFVFMNGAHVGVDFVIGALPHGAAVMLHSFSALVTIGLVALMLWQGWNTFTVRTMFGDTSQQLGIPVAWYWYPLLVGLVVSLLAISLEFIARLNSENDK